jgi:hypothetical protein
MKNNTRMEARKSLTSKGGGKRKPEINLHQFNETSGILYI